MRQSEIDTHLAAGRYYGYASTCLGKSGKGKMTHFSEEAADNHAFQLNNRSGEKTTHLVEAYPCYFCSPDRDNGVYYWHVGRAMDSLEWELFADSATKLLEMEDNDIDGVDLRTHPKNLCEGNYCCIHNPSDHRMRTWPRNWRSDRRIMERICIHGIGHPDPDDAAYRRTIGDNDTVHGCDGCC